MTAITPDIGLRARLRRLAGATAVLAIAVSGCAFVAPSAAVAADQAQSDDEKSVELHVSAGLRGLVAPGSSTSAIVTVENATDAALTTGQVEVELNRTPLTDAAAVSTWLDDGEATGAFASIGAEDTDPIDGGASATTTIFVSEATLGNLAPGVYPLRAELTASAGDAADAEAVDATATSVLVIAAPPDRAGRSARSRHGDARRRRTADGRRALGTSLLPDGALTAQLDGRRRDDRRAGHRPVHPRRDPGARHRRPGDRPRLADTTSTTSRTRVSRCSSVMRMRRRRRRRVCLSCCSPGLSPHCSIPRTSRESRQRPHQPTRLMRHPVRPRAPRNLRHSPAMTSSRRSTALCRTSCGRRPPPPPT